jgi:hypothetical protein
MTARDPMSVLREIAMQTDDNRIYEAIAQVEALSKAVTRLTNDRHYFDRANSPDDGESCGKCGHNWRSTEYHLSSNENGRTDRHLLIEANKPFTPPSGGCDGR